MTERPVSALEPGDELELSIEKLIAGGDGLARADGLPVFVARSAPGDRVRVRIWQRKPSYARGEVVEILEPGPERREPPCPYFSRCGGCDLQHLEDDAQLRYKAAAVRETLERLGGIEWPADARVVAGAPWAYRLRARFHLEAGTEAEGAAVGYRERASHRLVAVDRCPVLTPELEEFLARLPSTVDAAAPPRRIDVAAGEEGLTLAPPLGGAGGGPVSRSVGAWRFWYDARCFFQAHAGLLHELVQTVVGDWKGDVACDLYAGVGLFAVPLAERYGRVTAVEGDRVAVRYHRRNLRENRSEGVQVVSQAVETWIGEMPSRVDRVVMDPPRAGLDARVRAGLLARAVPRLTYVSCHPAAMARDLKMLSGEYGLESLTLLDLFPQTGHIEVVAQLARR